MPVGILPCVVPHCLTGQVRGHRLAVAVGQICGYTYRMSLLYQRRHTDEGVVECGQPDCIQIFNINQ